MKRMLGLVLICACAGGALGQEEARVQPNSKSKQPFEIVRSMQAIQDQIVLGNGEAQSKLPKLIGQIAQRLLAADSSVWREAKNARAVTTYTLSGGQPRVVRKVLEFGVSPAQETLLMEGALAYVEGREAKAKQILLPIDAKALAPAVGGHVAMVQSALIAKSDPGKAMELLDQARLLAPGTLVEEAALRREVFLSDETRNLEKFVSLSSQYIRRFPRSVYADNFRRGFADAVARFGLTNEASEFAKLENLLNEFADKDQLDLYLKIAQSGLIKGKIASAHFAAERAIRLSKNGGAERARSKLYEAATLILTRSLDAGVVELDNVESARLPKRDAELKAAVGAIAKEIRKAPDATLSLNEPEPLQEAAPARREPGVSAAASALIESAQGALRQTDEILGRSAP
jgi:chemotaxis protein MotC